MIDENELLDIPWFIRLINKTTDQECPEAHAIRHIRYLVDRVNTAESKLSALQKDMDELEKMRMAEIYGLRETHGEALRRLSSYRERTIVNTPSGGTCKVCNGWWSINRECELHEDWCPNSGAAVVEKRVTLEKQEPIVESATTSEAVVRHEDGSRTSVKLLADPVDPRVQEVRDEAELARRLRLRD